LKDTVNRPLLYADGNRIVGTGKRVQRTTEVCMKELDSLLKVISEGMRTLAGGVATLAEKVDDIAKSQASQRKSGPAPSPKTATAKKTQKKGRAAPAKKKAASKAKKPASSSAPNSTAVLKAIGNSKAGVSSASIQAKTGLSARQVSNAVYKLKKAGKVKSVKRGAYIKA
jgi:predicted Rossmann fold nucleotide-binding protein DprA/Smf involved in DNA uptake